MVIKNKRGWIRIIEAFVAILLIAGCLLIIIDRSYIKEDISSKVYDAEVAILREIQLNDSLREDILNASNPPVSWDNLPSDVKNKIISRTPDYLDCEAKICETGDACTINGGDLGKDIYAQSVIITTTLTVPAPDYRQLKLFCWVK